VEISLKARICRTTHWTGFPETRGEFQDYQSFKTHNLDVLLKLSGVSEKIKTTYLTEWSAVATWDPEARYNPVGTARDADARLLVQAAKQLLKALA